MTEYKKANKQESKRAEKRSRINKSESNTPIEKLHGWDQSQVLSTETPFQPQIDKHIALLKTSGFDKERSNLVLNLQQAYGNRYVQRLVGSIQSQPKKELKSPDTVQLAPSKPEWGGRGGSKYAPLPWTYDELKRMKDAELRNAKTKKDKELLDQKYFRGEQVIKNWDNRYGNWKFPCTDEWAQWFQLRMKEFGKFSYYPDKLWREFLSKRAEGSLVGGREVAINPFWPEKDKVRYELFKDELESRDPTSVEFYRGYSKYINPVKPRDLVEPPKDAQKFLKESAYADPMTNNQLRTEIKRLRKVLKLEK